MWSQKEKLHVQLNSFLVLSSSAVLCFITSSSTTMFFLTTATSVYHPEVFRWTLRKCTFTLSRRINLCAMTADSLRQIQLLVIRFV